MMLQNKSPFVLVQPPTIGIIFGGRHIIFDILTCKMIRYYFTFCSEATVSYTYQYQLETSHTNHAVYNVSQLLDSLLSNYDNSLRPDLGGKYQHQVYGL